MNTLDKFRLDGKVCVITGGAGLLGVMHAEAILDAGGKVVLIDNNKIKLEEAFLRLGGLSNNADRVFESWSDITSEDQVKGAVYDILVNIGPIKILINNAANNPKLENGNNLARLENFPVDQWQKDIAVCLTGSFLMSKHIGSHMAKSGGGVILNVASDLGVIAPDQRIYQKSGLSPEEQPVKPVTYSVTKHALIGLTKYLATYWSDRGVRVNSISPGGVYNGQPDEFVAKLTQLIPMGRMASMDEYKAAVLFLCSDASSYMTGANLVIDGGRTCW